MMLCRPCQQRAIICSAASGSIPGDSQGVGPLSDATTHPEPQHVAKEMSTLDKVAEVCCPAA